MQCFYWFVASSTANFSPETYQWWSCTSYLWWVVVVAAEPSCQGACCLTKWRCPTLRFFSSIHSLITKINEPEMLFLNLVSSHMCEGQFHIFPKSTITTKWVLFCPTDHNRGFIAWVVPLLHPCRVLQMTVLSFVQPTYSERQESSFIIDPTYHSFERL